MLYGIVPVLPARTMGSFPRMAVMGRTKRRGLGASSYSLQVSAFVIQSSASGSGAPYGSSLDRRAHFMRTDPATSVRTTMVKRSKHLQYHVVWRGMKQCRIGTPGADKDKVLAVALAPKVLIRKRPGINPLNALEGLVADCHTAEQAYLSSAFLCLLRFHARTQGIHLMLM